MLQPSQSQNMPFHLVFAGQARQLPLISKNPALQTQAPLTLIWLDPQFPLAFEEHWAPSKEVPSGQDWQSPLIKLKPALQAQVAPFQAALAPQEGPWGSHQSETGLRKYPLAQSLEVEQVMPFQLVPVGQGAQTPSALW